MTTKKETDDLGPKSRTRKPSQHKIDQFVEGIAAGKSGPDAVIDAGWPQQRNSAKVRACKLLANPEIAQAVERRKAEAMRRANCHTDIVIGSLVEITTSSIADVCDEEGNFSLPLAVARGTDHLIKKLTTTERHSKDGSRRVTHAVEMYSRLDALNQLRETWGMKQEARRNDADSEALRAEVEKSLARIMERDGVDQPTAAQVLRG